MLIGMTTTANAAIDELRRSNYHIRTPIRVRLTYTPRIKAGISQESELKAGPLLL